MYVLFNALLSSLKMAIFASNFTRKRAQKREREAQSSNKTAKNMTTNSGVIKCFIPQTISSDVKLRQKVLSVFNKRRSDFPNEAKYNDYLEHVEEIVFNAIEGIASATETEKILQKEKREHVKEIKERKERNLEEDRVSCPEKFNVVFGGGGGGGEAKEAEDEEMLQMMMDYQPEGGGGGGGAQSSFVAEYTEYDETTEEGKKAKKEASLKACGFDPLKTEYERSVIEAFQTIRV